MTSIEYVNVEGVIEIEWRPGIVEERRELVLADAPFKKSQPQANVGVKIGMTKNMGDYNSVRFDVSLFLPCYAGEENDVYVYAKSWVEDRVTAINEEIEEANE